MVTDVRIAVGSVGARPVRATDAERALTGKAPGDAVALAAAATLAAEASQAVADANGSVEYKENIVRVLVERCFRKAVSGCS
jgi:CO/xanthine dehydrogenase FAD-binding subunit